MTTSSIEDGILVRISHGQQLIEKGKLAEVYSLLEEIRTSNNISEQVKELTSNWLKVKIDLELGKYAESLKTLHFLKKNMRDSLTPLIETTMLLDEAEALIQLGRLDECSTVFKQIEGKLHQKQIKEKREIWGRFFYLKGRLEWRSGHHELALAEYHDSLARFQRAADINGMALVLKDLGNVYREKGEFSLARTYYDRSLKLLEEIGNKKNIGALYNNLGILSWSQGDLDEALEMYDHCLHFWKEVHYDLGIARVLNNIGVLHSDKGNLNLALDYLDQSLELWEKIGNKQEIARVLNNMGIIYMNKGELDEALAFQLRCLELRRQLGNEQSIADTCQEIGRIHHLLANLSEAKEHYKKAFEIRKQIGNYTDLSASLLWLVVLSHEMREQDDLDHYMTLLDELSKDTNQSNPRMELHVNLARAYILKHKTRIRELAWAQELFMKAIDLENPIDHELTIFALFNYCDTILHEINLTKNSDLLQELREWIKKIKHVASLESSYLWLTEAYTLEAQISLVEGKVDVALQILRKAEELVNERHLTYLGKRISNIMDEILLQSELLSTSESWKRSIIERLEETRVFSKIKELATGKLSSVPELPPEEPVMFLITTENGVPLITEVIDPQVKVNEMLIGGFLAAINTFGKELFSKNDQLDRIMYQNHTIMFKVVNRLLFCYVFKGQSYSARKRMQRILQKIKSMRDVWNSLRATRGGINILARDLKVSITQLISEELGSAQ